MKQLRHFISAIVVLVVLLILLPASAQAYLHVQQAENKARTNSWNLFCNGNVSACPTYPWIYQTAQRLSSATVDTFVRVYRYGYGTCNRRIRVTGDDYDMRVMEGQSGYWFCS